MSKPRLGFLGVGWIGRHRMQAVAESGVAEITAIADPVADMREQARLVAPRAQLCERYAQLLELDLDGIVIATPSALHAEQARGALERGLAVFCQKPLGRNAIETQQVVDAARHADRRLGVDLSYRQTEALRTLRDLARSGELGRIFTLELVFHNAYGPDKPWFYDRARSGGGCMMDLGIHLVDAALWMLDFPRVVSADGRLFHKGEKLAAAAEQVEDYAMARLDLEGDRVAQLACSWCLPAGQDAVIAAEVYGTAGGAALRNVGGSFFDFRLERFRGTARETLVEPPDAWGGRAAVAWAEALGQDRSYDPEVAHIVEVARTLDRLYGGGRGRRL